MENAIAVPALCLDLGHAFLPPLPSASARVFRDDFADDLAALAAEAAIDISEHAASLKNALAAFESDDALLAHYSRLFLFPPTRARLNLGYYLDGSVNGPSLDAIESLQNVYGICKLEAFRELVDHLTSLLEFLALLLNTPDAEADRIQLSQLFLLPGVSRLCRIISTESDIDSPYLHLARITETMLQHIASPARLKRGRMRHRRARVRVVVDKGRWRNCISCDTPYAREQEMQIMEKALGAQNLSAEHLALCPVCRHVAQTWFGRELDQYVGGCH